MQGVTQQTFPVFLWRWTYSVATALHLPRRRCCHHFLLHAGLCNRGADDHSLHDASCVITALRYTAARQRQNGGASRGLGYWKDLGHGLLPVSWFFAEYWTSVLPSWTGEWRWTARCVGEGLTYVHPVSLQKIRLMMTTWTRISSITPRPTHRCDVEEMGVHHPSCSSLPFLRSN